MYLSATDITNVFLTLIEMLLNQLQLVVSFSQNIIILNSSLGSSFGLNFDVSLFDLFVGTWVVGLIFGTLMALPHVITFDDYTRSLYR